MAETIRQNPADDMMVAEDENEDTQANKYLFFRIGKESYGIGIRHIIEIIEVQKISSVPDMPAYVKGVINLRGKVIPVVDLRLRFNMEGREYDDRTCTIVTEVDGTLIGFIVDTVEEVLEIPETQVEPPPNFKSTAGKDRYIQGLGKVGEAVKILLNVEKIVREDDVRLIESAATA